VSLVELADGRRGEGGVGAKSYDRESLALYKSFNTLFLTYVYKKANCISVPLDINKIHNFSFFVSFF
jgi:hypothetical protein